MLASLLHQQSHGMGSKALDGLHFPSRAKRVIFLFMHGGPSQVDTFDYKPQLIKDDGKPLPFEKPRVQFSQTGNLLKSHGHLHSMVNRVHGSASCFQK